MAKKSFAQAVQEQYNKHNSSGGNVEFESFTKTPGTYLIKILHPLSKDGDDFFVSAFHKGLETFNNDKKVYCIDVDKDSLMNDGETECPVCQYFHSETGKQDRQELKRRNNSKQWSNYLKIKPVMTLSMFVAETKKDGSIGKPKILTLFNDQMQDFLDYYVQFDYEGNLYDRAIKMGIGKVEKEGYTRTAFKFLMIDKELPLNEKHKKLVEKKLGDKTIKDIFNIDLKAVDPGKVAKMVALFRKGFKFDAGMPTEIEDLSDSEEDDGFGGDESDYNEVKKISDDSDDDFDVDEDFGEDDFISDDDSFDDLK